MSVPLQNQYQPNFIRYAFPVNSSSQLITTTWPTGVPMTFAPSDASIMTSNVAPSSSVPSKSETSSRCTSPNISVVRPFSAPQNKTSLYNDQSLIRDDSNAVADFSSYSAEQVYFHISLPCSQISRIIVTHTNTHRYYFIWIRYLGRIRFCNSSINHLDCL